MRCTRRHHLSLALACHRRANSAPLPHHHRGGAIVVAFRFNSDVYTKDQRRNQPNADPYTGQQMHLCEAPDLVPTMNFAANTLEHVHVKELPRDVRNESDIERERRMRSKYGELGPGETPTKSSGDVRRDMLQEAQDIDGLPWEVRWRKTMIPTSEEVVQEIRDRMDLFVQDPIDREVEWYLHWKDRMFRVQKDRLIWPQGFTDYLDHYDAYGRRRVLPSDQRWSDTSWKHLADKNFRDRMWLVEGEERKAATLQLAPREELLEKEGERWDSATEVLFGMQTGVINNNPDQIYESLAGTANPLEVTKAKAKIAAYGMTQQGLLERPGVSQAVDAVTGMPKSELEPLPSGLTVEQAAFVAMQSNVQNEMVETAAETASATGKDPTMAALKAHHRLSKRAGDQPGLQTLTQSRVDRIRAIQQQLEAGEGKVQPQSLPAPPESDSKREQEGSPLPPLHHPLDSVADSTTQAPTTSAAAPPQRAATGTEGFVKIPRRPKGAEPDLSRELFYTPSSVAGPQQHGPKKGSSDDDNSKAMPQWYRQQIVETQPPLIRSYGMTGDPLETFSGTQEEKNEAAVSSSSSSAPPREHQDHYYQKPRNTPPMSADDARDGPSAFDEVRFEREKATPELTREFEPLPLYREVASSSGAATGAAPGDGGASSAEAKRKRMLEARRLRTQRAKEGMDHDLMLPMLPWEGDSTVDPYRGVNPVSVAFNRKDLQATWDAYRNFFRQTLSEFSSLTKAVSEEDCIRMILDAIQRVRAGHVGQHPAIPEEQVVIIRTVFEGHFKQFLSDFFRHRGERSSEAAALKSESEALLKRASAKCKLLGKEFVDFMQEMVSNELNLIRKNPVQRHALVMRDKAFEPILRSFGRWIETTLVEFSTSEFTTPEQVQANMDVSMRLLKECRHRIPSRFPGVADGIRDRVVEAMYQWCAGSLNYFAARHYFNLFMSLAETRLRGKAEDLSEYANEHFESGYSVGKDLLTLPIPGAETVIQYSEEDFLEGQHAGNYEMMGDLSRAEALWHSGTVKRWYPVADETEFMWYCERRGRYSVALDVSDRCLESLNKRTHPSIHAFPERARKFLEGAPLTQETAEHLWLRYMGDVYWDHHEFMARMGRFQTSRGHRETALNMYHLAIRTAKEKLPASWRAPLLTTAKYLMRCYVPGHSDPYEHVKLVDDLVDRIATMEPKDTLHWFDDYSGLPIHLAVLHGSIMAYHELVLKEAAKTATPPTTEEVMRFAAERAKGGVAHGLLPSWVAAVQQSAETHFRSRVAKWLAREPANSDAALRLVHLYFTIRVQPTTAAQVQHYWDMYYPSYQAIYTQCALEGSLQARSLLSDSLRFLCQIVGGTFAVATREQLLTLQKELVHVRDRLANLIDKYEMQRSLTSLDLHLADPTKPLYAYGTSTMERTLRKLQERDNSPLLRIDFAAKDYRALLDRTRQHREYGAGVAELQANSRATAAANSPTGEPKALDEVEKPSVREVLLKGSQ